MIKIIADSTCDLPQDLLQKFDISILPLYIHLGADEFVDGVSISPAQIYAWSDEHKLTPQTAAPSLAAATELFSEHIGQADEIICFAISESMSTSANVMRLAAESIAQQERIHIIDSANLSSGIGLLVLEAAEMAQAGKSAAEIIAKIEELKPKIRASFVVDTLNYLHRGGRCSSIAALAGSVLHIHPKIVVEQGKMQPSKKYKGKMQRVIMSYAKDMENDIKNARKNRIFITHSGCEKNVIEKVRAYLQDLKLFDEILVSQAGGVISSHCGPGTLGVLFIAE